MLLLVMNSKCLLCNGISNLVESHIYPKWMIKSLYPSGKITAPYLVKWSHGLRRKKRIIKGSFERLFCEKCDNVILGRIESEVKSFFFLSDDKFKLIADQTGYITYYSKHIDLTRFILSIVYRVSVTTLSEFSGISLNQKHLETIRYILLGDQQSNYNIFLTRFENKWHPNNPERKVIFYPQMLKLEGVSYIKLYLSNGFIAYIKLGMNKHSFFDSFSINSPTIIVIKQRVESDNLYKMLVSDVLAGYIHS